MTDIQLETADTTVVDAVHPEQPAVSAVASPSVDEALPAAPVAAPLGSNPASGDPAFEDSPSADGDAASAAHHDVAQAVPADAPHPDDAQKLIAFLLQPDVMAAITNQVRYPNAVPASLPMVRPEVRDDRNVFPTAEDQARMFTVRAAPQAAERARTRMWTRFKAGG